MEKNYFKTCSYSGIHLLIELWDAENLDNIELIEVALKQAATATGATIINSFFHKFNPIGVTGVVLLSESHISIHSFPERKYAALDIFTCGDCNPHLAIPVLKNYFNTSQIKLKEEIRGLDVGINRMH